MTRVEARLCRRPVAATPAVTIIDPSQSSAITNKGVYGLIMTQGSGATNNLKPDCKWHGASV
jgi:hypothetical protein